MEITGNTSQEGSSKTAIELHHQKKKHSRATVFFYVFTVFLLLFGFYYFSEIKEGIRLLGDVDLAWLSMAIAAQLLTFLFTAIVYYLLLKSLEGRNAISLGSLYRASVISVFFNQTIPSAGISGNTFLFNFLLKKDIPTSSIISVIVAELLIFYSAFEILIVVLLLICLFLIDVSVIFQVVLASGMVAYLLFGIAISSFGKMSVSKLYQRLSRRKYLKWLARKMDRSVRAHPLAGTDDRILVFLTGKKSTTLHAFFWQQVILAADTFTLWALMEGMGVDVTLLHVLLVLVSTKVVSLLPFAPGGLILFESSMTFLFVSLDIPFAEALAGTIVYRLLTFWLPIPAGLFLYRRWTKHGT